MFASPNDGAQVAAQPTPAPGTASAPAAQPCTVVLADDHELVRTALRGLCERMAGLTVVGEAGNGNALLALIRRLQPDLVITDLVMPELNGLDAIRRIHAEFPDMRLMVLSAYDNAEYVRDVMASGALGYVTKDCLSGELSAAIQQVRSGQPYVSPHAAGALVRDLMTETRGGAVADDQPTSREREVLRLMADGKSSKEIADLLGVSPSTVDVHRHNLMRKLGVSSVAGLIKYAIRRGIVALG